MISDRLLTLLEHEEGFRPDVYLDTRGYWTVGCGHLVSTDKTLTPEQAAALCGAPWTLDRARTELRMHVELTVTQLAFAFPWFKALPILVSEGLTNMAYQLGLKGVQGFPNMLRSLEAGMYADAERHALDSDWARDQTPARAARTAGMLGNRVFPA